MKYYEKILLWWTICIIGVLLLPLLPQWFLGLFSIFFVASGLFIPFHELFTMIVKKNRMAKFEHIEEFEDIYQKMKNLFGKEYEKNKRRLRPFIITFFALLVVFVCLINVSLNFGKMLEKWEIGILFGTFFVFFIIEGICLFKIIDIQLINKKTYETFLLPIFISDIDNNLKYKKKLPSTEKYVKRRYINSGIESRSCDVFKCEDFVIRRIRWCNTF